MGLINKLLIRLGLKKAEDQPVVWKVDRDGVVVVPSRRVVLRAKRKEE